jgi:hypothetical protein
MTHEQSALETLAKAECIQLCARITTQLPRELRDIVYSYLVPKSQVIDREYFRSTMDPVTKLHTYDQARWKAKWHPEHWWNESYVGEAFARELLDQHYSTSTFVFGDDAGLIQRFLESDQMQSGYSPFSLVSRIEIQFRAMTFDRSSCVGYMFGIPTKPERLQAALEGADMLKGGASVVVRFATQAKDEKQKEEQIVTACTALVPRMADMRRNGLRVRLVVDETEEIEVDGVGTYASARTAEVENVAGN